MLIKKLQSALRRKVGKHVVHNVIIKFSNNSKKTLDLGCGNSPTADIFSNRIGVDIISGPGVDIVADAHDLPFDSGSFEQIICSEVLEHLVDPKKAAEEMARVLCSGGTLILTVPFVYPIHEAPYDYQRFTLYGLHKLFEPHFEVEQIKELYTEEQTLAILLQRIAFQRQNSWFKYYFYLLLSHVIFRYSKDCDSLRYQDIGKRVPGKFLTAGYLLVAKKR